MNLKSGTLRKLGERCRTCRTKELDTTSGKMFYCVRVRARLPKSAIIFFSLTSNSNVLIFFKIQFFFHLGKSSLGPCHYLLLSKKSRF